MHFTYLEKDEDRHPSVSLAKYVVLKLIEPFTSCGRTVTTDNQTKFGVTGQMARKYSTKSNRLVDGLSKYFLISLI